MNAVSGKLSGHEKRKVAIVAGRFNEAIVKNLVEGTTDTLLRHGLSPKNITLCWVPGAFEIPLVAKKWALSGKVDAVICLGTVIRGATPHFDYVAGQAASGCAQAAMESGRPVIFGVLTTDTIEQAVERAGTKSGNKGRDAATTALEMICVLEQLEAL